ncbi:DUF5131 family protein [Rubrivirga sp.]|uniref:DUF5131 family protein n=1 Tax=Rubrivirga sp. TaxID=1885344 RepID=UPI003C7097C3
MPYPPLPAAPPSDIHRLPHGLRTLIEANHEKGLYWDDSINPQKGCDPVSTGCTNCFMLDAVKKRYSKMPGSPYFGSDGSAMFFPKELDKLRDDFDPKRYFSPIMGDPYHEDFNDETVALYHEALRQAPYHWIYSFTKRSERLAEVGREIEWGPHICSVVSVENEDYLYRIADQWEAGALRNGVSFEPVVGEIRDTPELRRLLSPPGGRPLDIMFIGGESTKNDNIRPMREAWARTLIRVGLELNVPVFFKQVGDVDFDGRRVGAKKAGRVIDGRTYDALPRGCVDHLVRAPYIAEAARRRSR